MRYKMRCILESTKMLGEFTSRNPILSQAVAFLASEKKIRSAAKQVGVGGSDQVILRDYRYEERIEIVTLNEAIKNINETVELFVDDFGTIHFVVTFS